MSEMKYLILALVAIIVGLIVWLVIEQGQWEKYRDLHHCETTGDTRWVPIMVCTGVKVTTCIPVMTQEFRWTCDDSTEHWRTDD